MSEFSDWSENERYGACGDAERTNREENASESHKASLQEHDTVCGKETMRGVIKPISNQTQRSLIQHDWR